MSAFNPSHTVVWFEIPVTDMDRSRAFYGSVLQAPLKMEEGGPNPMAVFAGDGESSVRGHLYPGKPAAQGSGPTVHLASPLPLEDALVRVGENGGQVVSPIVEIPAGRFAYCLDPDGNSFGLFAS
jgi:predicted enzyme related to lactoylglutathione lyase